MKTLKPTCLLKAASLFCFCLFVQQNLNAQDAIFEWAKSNAGGVSITMDTEGNVLITGYFWGVADFDPGSAVLNLISLGGTDIFVQKLDSNGTLLWAVSIGGTSNQDQGNSIKTDVSGNVYVTGVFRTTVDFDPGPGTFNLTSFGGGDIFVLKLDKNGNFRWVKQMGGANINKEEGYSITLDAARNIYTTGTFYISADFDPGPGSFILPGGSPPDIFVSKLDSNGNFLWAKQIAGFSLDWGYSITTDANGNVYTSGSYAGNVDFDPGAGTFYLASSGGEVFIQKLDANGNFIWAKDINNLAPGYGGVVAVDASGNVYTAAGYYSIYLQKLDANGNFIWSKEIDGTEGDFVHSVFIDPAGDIYLTGGFQDTVDFDPDTSSVFNLISSGDKDIYILKLNANGSFIWAKRMGGVQYDGGSSVAIDAAYNIYTTGGFRDIVDFDPDYTMFNLVQPNSGTYSAFVQKLRQRGVIGVVYKDFNQNCIRDSFETGLSNPTLVINPGNILVQTNDAGVWTIDYLPAGTYTVTADTSGNWQSNCPISQSFAVTTPNGITTAPSFGFIASCTVSFFYTNSGIIHTFRNISTGGNLSYSWNFSDGFTSSSESPIHFYPPGTYNACLSISNSFGCQDSSCQSITVPNPSGCNASFTYSNSQNVYTFQNTSSGTNPSTYSWNFGDGGVSTQQHPVHTFAAGTYTVSLIISDTMGCADIMIDTIIVGGGSTCAAAFTYSNQQNTYTFQNTSIGTNLSYSWDFGDGASSTQQNPSHTFASGTYNVCLAVSDTSGCSDSTCTAITVTVNQNLVWPGDANSDGIANVWDVLAIGIGYGNSGPARPNATTNWVGQPCPDWQLQFLSGVNLKHADCDGNALIDSNDVSVISLNYGLTHAKGGTPERAADPDLFLVFPQDSFQTGDTVTGTIHLGTPTTPVTNIYGIAFSLNYNQNIIDSNGINVDFINSWFTPQTNRIGLAKNLYAAAKTDVGLSRTSHSNASGSGAIADVSFVIQDNIDGKDYFVLPLELQFEEVMAIDKDETTVNITANGDTLYVEGETVGIKPIQQQFNVRIFPNPAANEINVVADVAIIECSIMDIAGREVLREMSSLEEMTSLSIDVSALESGSYFINLKSADHYFICRRVAVFK